MTQDTVGGETVVVETSNCKNNNSQRRSRNPFKKKQKTQNSGEEIKDEREPELKFQDAFTIYKVIGMNWFLILLGTIGAMGSGVIPISFQFVMGDLVNVFSPTKADGTPITTDEQKDLISTYAGQFAIIAAGSAIANFMTQFFLNWASERIGVALRGTYFDSLTTQEMGFFDIKKVGSLTITLSEDITRIQEIYTVKLATLFQNMTQFIVGVILALVTGWQMALVMISTTPLMILGVVILGGVIRKLTLKINHANDHSAALATEVSSCMRTVRSMAGEEKERLRFQKDTRKMYLAGIVKSISLGATFGLLTAILWGTASLAFWFGGGLVVEGTMDIGSMLKVFGLTLFAIMGISASGGFFPDYTKAMVSQKTVLKVLMRKAAIPFKGGKTLDSIIGNVTFENIDFVYPSRPNVTVLKNFSLEIKAGESAALVGPSGSGKSTIVGLLERFYEPARGKIYLDGVDLAELDPFWLHRNLGIVTQEPIFFFQMAMPFLYTQTLFATTIYKNIAYAIGEENTTMEKVMEAAKSANCHSFIMELPDGYNTLLGERGVSLSGGQKQRVCIARALLQNPKILLLDEATSALDTESESLVQAALDLLMKGRTSICIAHRLSTVRNANKICVLVKGDLKETGTHDQLMNVPSGIYKNLAQKQMLFSNGGGVDGIEKDLEVTMDILQ